MRIDTFKIEEWMNFYTGSAKYDLTSTCIKPLSIKELLSLSGISTPDIFDLDLTYGEIEGTERLKNAILTLYERQKTENITITHGAIGANQLVYESLLEPNDEVIAILPAYQQHYSIPKFLGQKVKFLFLKEENNWQINLRELENTISSKTKLISFTNPNNPTGSVISDEYLIRISEIAKERNIWILADEVYRGLNISGNPYSRSIADIYTKGISVGSMSKTYSLPGLRVGWICTRSDLISEINKHRQYNTISVSLLDEYFSAIAIENRKKIATRNFEIINRGYKILQDWSNQEVYIKLNMPQGGTTAFARYKKDIPSRTLCKDLQAKTGVALLPGETMDMEGFVRIGFCTDQEILETGLKLFSKYLRTL